MTAPFSYMAFVIPAVGLGRVAAAVAVLPTAVAPAVGLGRIAAAVAVLPITVTPAVGLGRVSATVIKAEKIIEKVIEHIKILVFLWFELRK